MLMQKKKKINIKYHQICNLLSNIRTNELFI